MQTNGAKTRCPHCKGSGKVKLWPQSERTLEIVTKLGRPTAAEVHAALGESIDISATHNRLTGLVSRGLLKKGRGAPHRFSVV